MKKNIFVFAVLVTAFISICAFQSDTDADKAFVTKVFESLKNNDRDAYSNLFIKHDEFMAMIDSSTWDVSKKTSMKKRFANPLYMDSLCIASYFTLQDRATQLGIDWKSAELISIDTKTKEIEGNLNLNFTVLFTSNKKRFSLSGDKVIKTASGWKMANKPGLIQAGS